MRYVLLLLLSLPSLCLADRPTLHVLTKRLVESDSDVVWRFKMVSDGLAADEPDDCELQVVRSDAPIMVAFAGMRSAVRGVTVVAGPFDPSGFAGRDALAAAHEALTAVSGLEPTGVKDWMKTNGPQLLTGEHAEHLRIDDIILSANCSGVKNGKAEIYFSVYWEAPDKPKPAPAPGMPQLERSFEDSPFWKDNVPRVYRHKSGVIVLFDSDRLGSRAVMEYRPASKEQASVSATVWLLISTQAASDAEIRENNDRIMEWLKSPTPLLELNGSTVQARDGEDGKLILTVREAE